MNLRNTLLAAAILCLILAIGGCQNDGSGDGSGGSGLDESDLLTEYGQTVGEMQGRLSDYVSGGPVGSANGTYHDGMATSLDRLAALRDRMQRQCQDLDGCPSGGGASGHMSDGCMRGGHMMGPADMDWMRQREEECRAELDRYWQQCSGLRDCSAYVGGHHQRMGSTLGEMWDWCDGWNSGRHQDWGDDDCCDHWGDCPDDEGHMGDDDRHGDDDRW